MNDNNVETAREIKKNQKRAFAKLGYSKPDVEELTKAMNDLLANYSVHYQNLRNFHWNVKGSNFFDLHTQFEEEYNFVKVAIDNIAERIRVYGATPFSTMKDFLANAEIPENESNLPSEEMVRIILEDYQVLLNYMFKVVDVAIDNGDLGTEDMVKCYIKFTEKRHWIWTAFSQK
jgi:starvation-inducible DNA-binding protein